MTTKQAAAAHDGKMTSWEKRIFFLLLLIRQVCFCRHWSFLLVSHGVQSGKP